jgi:hypothetical protein
MNKLDKIVKKTAIENIDVNNLVENVKYILADSIENKYYDHNYLYVKESEYDVLIFYLGNIIGDYEEIRILDRLLVETLDKIFIEFKQQEHEYFDYLRENSKTIAEEVINKYNGV